ncbi:MAG TPA: hypothetical protein VL754_06390 [Verrucomicrobiae bacterium]|jgi:hypothetical protein|nr:hypothetical protein [Verrucomicrobiae bacterium]
MTANFVVTFELLAMSASIVVAAEAPKPRDDVAQMIMIMDGPRDKNCGERKMTKTEVIEAAQDKTPIVERWTLDRCGRTVHYLVKYSKGGKDFDVQIEK